jgi:hypothetical protein
MFWVILFAKNIQSLTGLFVQRGKIFLAEDNLIQSPVRDNIDKPYEVKLSPPLGTK